MAHAHSTSGGAASQSSSGKDVDSKTLDAKVELESGSDSLEALPRYQGTYDAGGDERFYRPIDTYEGRHRYDPDFQWRPEEEKKLVRKVRPQSWGSVASPNPKTFD